MSVSLLGEPIPANTQHAISVSLPTWSSNVGYEENEDWVIKKMRSGYPRFFIHPELLALEDIVKRQYGLSEERCIFFPSISTATRCSTYILSRLQHTDFTDNQPLTDRIRILFVGVSASVSAKFNVNPSVWAIIVPFDIYTIAREYWQHTGEGVSSRRAAFLCVLAGEGHLMFGGQETDSGQGQLLPRGPRRYSKQPSEARTSTHEPVHIQNFIEERYGRNLNANAVHEAKIAIKQRISGSIGDGDGTVSYANKQDFTTHAKVAVEDIFLFPTGMSAIYNTHRLIQTYFGPRKMVEFGFPYIDTLKVLQKFGEGCIFLGYGGEEDINELERVLQTGQKIAGLFCEFPSNPLLKSPNLQRLRNLADQHGFVIVVDETIGNFINVDVLPYADIVVSSLTKVFSGDSNVMGGSCIINPRMPYYRDLLHLSRSIYEDNFWDEDVVFLERNSRDFAARIIRINANAEALARLFLSSNLVKQVYYPSTGEFKGNYDRCKRENGGYGGLLSITFNSEKDAVCFYDLIETAKGPSLGTNFTLTSPYTLLAHYRELDWVAQYGVESHLIRISVGLEPTSDLVSGFEAALLKIAGEN